jgi:hypothetical protein
MRINSRLPIVYYVWILLSVVLLIALLFRHVNFFYSVFVTIFLSGVTYFVLARYACIIELDDSAIRVRYVFPIPGVVEFKLKDIEQIEFDLSWFFMLSEDFRMGVFYWYHPFDTITFYLKTEEGHTQNSVNINTSYFGTLKVYGHLKEIYRKS